MNTENQYADGLTSSGSVRITCVFSLFMYTHIMHHCACAHSARVGLPARRWCKCRCASLFGNYSLGSESSSCTHTWAPHLLNKSFYTTQRQSCQLATFCLTYSQRMGHHLHVCEKDGRSPSCNPAQRFHLFNPANKHTLNFRPFDSFSSLTSEVIFSSITCSRSWDLSSEEI